MKTAFQFAVFSLSISCLLGSGCNQYQLFRLAGHQQESFSNQADLLFVIDNSDSMVEEASSLATNFDDFVRDLTEGDEGATYDGLNDAVTDYIRFVTERSGFINYRLSITTTDVATSYGALYGDPDILTRGDKGVSDDFITNLLCEATCFQENDVPAGAGSCSSPLGSQVTQNWLDCTCGADVWKDNCALVGQEEGLEAIFMALCRSVAYPPDECYDAIDEFSSADELSNEGMLRDNATFIPVIITDEG
ncbi:MAG: hypothetical protein HN348_29110, partial [Proteobacteria bacterium]|nr:hypothetical protein [Pseudomonadota bacterium]